MLDGPLGSGTTSSADPEHALAADVNVSYFAATGLTDAEVTDSLRGQGVPGGSSASPQHGLEVLAVISDAWHQPSD
jgi:hypothetical protein